MLHFNFKKLSNIVADKSIIKQVIRIEYEPNLYINIEN